MITKQFKFLHSWNITQNSTSKNAEYVSFWGRKSYRVSASVPCSKTCIPRSHQLLWDLGDASLCAGYRGRAPV